MAQPRQCVRPGSIEPAAGTTGDIHLLRQVGIARCAARHRTRPLGSTNLYDVPFPSPESGAPCPRSIVSSPSTIRRESALRYRREGEETLDPNIGRYRVPPLIRLPALINAAEAVLSNTETAEDLILLLNEGSPLGGARPKSAVIDNGGRLAIARFPKNDDDRSMPHGELLAMTLAAAAGIRVAEATLLDVAGRYL